MGNSCFARHASVRRKGVSEDVPIGEIFLHARFCRIADGPDEVHMSQLGKWTIRDAPESDLIVHNIDN